MPRLLILAFAVFLASNGRAADYYFAPTGNDTTGNGSLGNPWQTVSKANATLAAGDTGIFRGGNYTHTITPENLGSEGSPITYVAYPGETPVVPKVRFGTDTVVNVYTVVDGFTVQGDTYRLVQFDYGANNNIVQNCTINAVQAYYGWAVVDFTYLSHHNTLKNSTVTGVVPCNPSHPEAAADLIYLHGGVHHNLIEGNTLSYATHVVVELQGDSVYDNVIRRNVITNPWHTGVNVYTSSYSNLVEQNYIHDCGSVCGETSCPANECGSSGDKAAGRQWHPGLVIGGPYNIVRNNIFVSNGSGVGSGEDAGRGGSHNRIYNNVVKGSIRGICVWGDRSQTDNDVRNNIVSLSRDYGIYEDVYGTPHLNTYINNSVFGASIYLVRSRDAPNKYTIPEIETALSTEWWGNLNVSPVFRGNYSLLRSSAENVSLVDAGATLTTTNGSGSDSTSLIVHDARYFTDGKGIITGDSIRIAGDTVIYSVTNVDYDTNTLTISPAATWSDGVGVTLTYDHAGLDVGVDPEWWVLYGQVILSGGGTISLGGVGSISTQ